MSYSWLVVEAKARIVFTPFTLDLGSERLCRGTETIDLPPKAFAVLRALVSRPGELVTKDELLQEVWPEVNVGSAVLKVSIAEIRKALSDDSHSPRFIETATRRGYRFIAPIEIEDTGTSADQPVTTRYALSGELQIAYQVLGNGPVDLVFVMGWVSHLEYFWTEPSFRRFLHRLASFSRLILFDKRGTGLSDRVPVDALPTLEQRMDDLRAVMDSAGSAQAVICGASEGGPMSALFAATYPERTSALVMIGTYAKRLRDESYPWGPTEQEREEFLRNIRDNWGGPVGLEERAPSVAGDPRFQKWWATYLRMACSPSAAVALTRMNSEIDVREVLPTIRVPTLVLHRTDDLCLNVEEGRYVARRIPGARFVELPGRDHLPFVGDQDSIIDEIQAFVTGMRDTRGRDRILATVLSMHFSETVPEPSTGRQIRELVKRHIAWFRGREIEFDGARLLAAFDGPARAIRCACTIASEAPAAGFTACAGLHTGECESAGESLRGWAVDLAVEISTRAQPGEILVSGTVRDLVAGSGIQFLELGDLSVAAVPGKWTLLLVEGECAEPAAAGR